MIKKIICLGLIIFFAMFSAGCNKKKITEKIVQKTYAIVVHAEKIVNMASPSSIMDTVKIIDYSTLIIKKAIVFVSRYCEEDTQEKINSILSHLEEFHSFVQSISEDNISEIQSKTIMYIERIKSSVKIIADNLGIQLPTDLDNIKGEYKDVLSTLIQETDELSQMIK